LRHQVLNKDIKPAYIFGGQHGSGKTSMARVFARANLCSSPVNGDPCNKCESCTSFLEERNPNFKEVDAATTGLVDDVRRIKEDALYAPYKADYKFLLMDESQRMTSPAQSALLKFLEEGHRTFVVLFATTDPEKMLPALRSRCMPQTIVRIPPATIVDRLQFICDNESIEYDTGGLELIVGFTNGHVRDAIMLLDQIRVLGPISRGSVSEVLQLDLQKSYYEILRKLKEDPQEAFVILESVLARVEPSKVARGIGQAAITAYTFGQGVKMLDMSVEKTECKRLFDIFGDKLLEISSQFSSQVEFNNSLLYCRIFQTRNLVVTPKLEEGKEAEAAPKTLQDLAEANLVKNKSRRMAGLETASADEQIPTAAMVYEMLTWGLLDGSKNGSGLVGANSQAPRGENGNAS